MCRHTLAKDEKVLHTQRPAHLGTRLATYHDRLDTRQIAFWVLGKLVKKHLADNCAKYGVAKKLQSLVGCQSVLGTGSVRKRPQKQILVGELVVDPLLAAFYNRKQ